MTRIYQYIANNPPIEVTKAEFSEGISINGTSNPIGKFQVGSTPSESFVILPDGSVGIGTTNPTSKLTVFGGDLKFGGNVVPTVDGIYNLGSTSARWNNIYTTTVTGSLVGAASSIIVLSDNINVNRYLVFSSQTTGITTAFVDSDITYNPNTNSLSINGPISATQFIRSGGTSAQFLKADGSIDSNAYLTSVGNGTLTLATSGTGISLGAVTTFTANQTTNSTITISSNATSSGTTNGTIVARGTNGDFTAGTISATQYNGTLQYSIGVSGALTITNNTAFNNTESKTINLNATSNNTANYVVQRDASGNFSAGTITASLTGNCSGSSGSCTGNAATASNSSQLNGLSSGYNGANIVLRTDGNSYLLIDNWIRTGSGTGFYNSFGAYLYEDTTYGWFARSRSNSSSSLRLQTTDGNARGWYYADNSNQQGFLSTGGSWNLKVDNSGNVTATGSVTANSDIKFKKEISTIENGLNKVLKLRGVEFVRKDDPTKTKQLGLIAQEVEKVIPEVVFNNFVSTPDGTTDEYKTISYQNIVALLIEAVKEQQKQIEDLKLIINTIKN